MKKILTQYLWIFVTVLILTCISISLFPDKKNRLEFIEERIKAVEEKKKILTQTERELEKLATERDWEQVDKDTTK
jgi:preprotein translocase subunit SecG